MKVPIFNNVYIGNKLHSRKSKPSVLEIYYKKLFWRNDQKCIKNDIKIRIYVYVKHKPVRHIYWTTCRNYIAMIQVNWCTSFVYISIICNRPFAHFQLCSKMHSKFKTDKRTPFHPKFNDDNIYFFHNLFKILELEQAVNFLFAVIIPIFLELQCTYIVNKNRDI